MKTTIKTITITDDGTLKTSEIIALMKKEFPVYSYYTDEQLDSNCPPLKNPTTRVFLATPEPDPTTLGLSYNDCIEKNLPLITLREYMLLTIAYFKETGDYLDRKGWTITSNLDSDGVVMGGCWSGDRCRLSFDDRDWRNSDCGPRSSVQVDTKMIQSNNEESKDNKGFCITCERCGFSKHI